MNLWIQFMVTGHYPGRVPPFGNSWINAYLQLPRTYRSLSRPSSAISALASTLRSFSLDLASTAIPFLRLLRWNCNLICEFPQHPLLTGIFREHCFNSECFPVQFSRCVLGCPTPLQARRSYAGRTPSVSATASRTLCALPHGQWPLPLAAALSRSALW